jgi:hypothetical protein
MVEELILRQGWKARQPRPVGAPMAVPHATRVRLKTVLASPGDLELLCPVDL